MHISDISILQVEVRGMFVQDNPDKPLLCYYIQRYNPTPLILLQIVIFMICQLLALQFTQVPLYACPSESILNKVHYKNPSTCILVPPVPYHWKTVT